MDRFVLGGALLAGAAFALPLSGSAAFAYLAGAVGLVALHERLRREFTPAASALASLLIFAGTSLFWSMTRAASPTDAVVFALVAGAMLPAARLPASAHRRAAWVLIAAIPVVQTIAWSALDLPAAPSRAEEILFSSTRGLFSLTPVVYAGVLGTVAYLRRERENAIAALAALLVFVVSRAVASNGAAGPFDHGLTAVAALIGPGLALAIDSLRRRPLAAAVPLVGAAILWNYWLMVQYTAGLLPKDEPVSFAALVRQQADVYTRSPYLYPFAFPSNVYFAWREGLPTDRYDVLAREPRSRDWDVVMDRRVDRFLLDGWGGAGTTPSGPVRWTAGRRATLAFPFAPAASRTTLLLVTSARVEEPAVSAELALELNGVEVGRFVATPAPSETTIVLSDAGVGRVLRAGYNRLTIVSHGIHRTDPADQRPLGPLATRSSDMPFPVAVYRIRVTSAS